MARLTEYTEYKFTKHNYYDWLYTCAKLKNNMPGYLMVKFCENYIFYKACVHLYFGTFFQNSKTSI